MTSPLISVLTQKVSQIKLNLRHILIITFLVHLSYLPNSFTWLDHGDIQRGRTIIPLTSIHQAFFTSLGQTKFYRPLITILNSLDFAIYHSHAWGYHLTNLVLHLGVTWITYYFLKYYFDLNKKYSLIGALITGIHPLTWLPVGAISYRSELLVTGFIAAALVCHIKFRTQKRLLFAILTLIFITLALIAKETAIFWLPLLIGFWEIKTRRLKFNYSIFIILEIILFTTYLWWRFFFLPSLFTAAPLELPWPTAISTRLFIFGQQALWLILPLKPGLSDAVKIISLHHLFPWLIISLIILGTYQIYRSGLSSLTSQFLIFLAIALAPALNLIHLPRATSPHYSYFALIGLGVGAYLILDRPWPPKKLIKPPAIIWLIIATWSTFTAGFLFKNDFTLFKNEVGRDPHFLEGQFYLGNYYLDQGQYSAADTAYQQILQASPEYLAYVDHTAFNINLAAFRTAQENYPAAEEILTSILQNQPSNSNLNVSYNLALIYFKQGKINPAITLLFQHQDNWRRPEPLLLLARLYLQESNYPQALAILKKSLPYLDSRQRANIQQLILEIQQTRQP